MSGISIEISQSGISALAGDGLTVGEKVKVEPIAGDRVSAMIVRKTGKIYGIEFLNLTAAQVEKISHSCQLLPLYRRNTLDI